MTTTQRTYIHIIQELENKDTDLVMRAMSALGQQAGILGHSMTEQFTYHDKEANARC